MSFRHLICVCFLAPSMALAAPAPSRPAAVERCVDAAFASNLSLQREDLDLDTARARLESAKGLFLPRLDVLARYSLSDGGRTIDLPVGDLLNPVYKTLNQMQGTQSFPSVSNQSIALQRAREQETKLRVQQPLYRPELSHNLESARASLASREASRAAFRRELRLEVERAYYRCLQAHKQAAVLGSTLDLVNEALRVNRSLVTNGAATEDAALRATAEVGEVRQQLELAKADEDLARSYLNFLLNRPVETPVELLSDADLELFSRALVAFAAEARDEQAQRREELDVLEAAQKSAAAGEKAIRAGRQPSVSLALESGIQGEGYSFNSNARYAQAHIVAEWNLFDGRQSRSREREAANQRRKLASQADELGRQIELQVRNARLRLIASVASLEAARMRLEAARAVFSLVARREREGLVNQLGFLDARHALTAAELGHAAAQASLSIAFSEFDRSLALHPAK